LAALGTGLAQGVAAQETLLFPVQTPANSSMSTEFFQPYADRITKASDGALVVDVRYGAALATARNIYDRILNDVVQLGWGLQNYVPGQFRLSEISALPFVVDRTVYTAEHASAAQWRLYKSGLIDAEYEQVIPLFLNVLTQSQLHTVRPLKSLEAATVLSGLKINGPAPHYGKVISRLGGAPVSFSTAETYESLQRNLMDGTITGFTAFPPYKLDEVTSYHVDTSLGTAAGMMFMTRKRYAALSAAARKAIDANSGEAPSRELGRFFQRTDDEVRARMKASPKHTVVELTPEQTAAWQQRIAPAIDELLADRPGGRKVLDEFRKQLAAVKAGS
jgi:TRAP-type C4-dicarboxylate transport system substrate-binding protein